MRLGLLADSSGWAELLREHLGALGSSSQRITALSWEAASSMLGEHDSGLLRSTPVRSPEPGQCPLPMVLLLETEPSEEPVGVSDWLVRGSLNLDVLRRYLRYAREQGSLRHTLQRLAEQDPLTGIANRQGFQTLLAARLAECGGRGLVLGHLDL